MLMCRSYQTHLSRLLDKAFTLTSSPEIARVLEEDNEIEEGRYSIGNTGARIYQMPMSTLEVLSLCTRDEHFFIFIYSP